MLSRRLSNLKGSIPCSAFDILHSWFLTLFKGLTHVLQGFVDTMHAGTCEQNSQPRGHRSSEWSYWSHMPECILATKRDFIIRNWTVCHIWHGLCVLKACLREHMKSASIYIYDQCGSKVLRWIQSTTYYCTRCIQGIKGFTLGQAQCKSCIIF